MKLPTYVTTEYKRWLCKRLNIPFDQDNLFEGFFSLDRESIENHRIEDRFNRWKNTAEMWIRPLTGQLYTARQLTPTQKRECLPVWQGYWQKFRAECPKAQSYDIFNEGNEEMNTTRVINQMKQSNVDAATLTAKLAAGRAANTIVNEALANALPWYKKLLGGKSALSTPLAKLAAAEAVLALAHTSQAHKHLTYVGEAMVQDAMSQLLLESNQFKSVIKQLESLVPSKGE